MLLLRASFVVHCVHAAHFKYTIVVYRVYLYVSTRCIVYCRHVMTFCVHINIYYYLMYTFAIINLRIRLVFYFKSTTNLVYAYSFALNFVYAFCSSVRSISLFNFAYVSYFLLVSVFRYLNSLCTRCMPNSKLLTSLWEIMTGRPKHY